MVDMKKGLCYVVGAGEKVGAFTPRNGDFVVAADGGVDFLRSLGVSPDLFVGDLDSADRQPEDCLVLRFNTDKDKTDMALAVEEGLGMGYRRFALFGGTGGRLDHTLANLQLVAELSAKGCQAYLIGDGIIVTAVTDGTLTLPQKDSGTVSVFSHSDRCTGVFLRGLKYTLENETLTNAFALGVSNAFVDQPASVTVGEGTLFVMWQDETDFR